MHSNKLILQPTFLWFLILSYSMVMVLANWFDVRLIQIFGLNTDAGTLVFPFTFLLSDLITEVYGFKYARRAIWCGFLFNAVFVIYGQVIIHLPSPSYATQNAAFDALFALDKRIIFASAISYLCSEPLNSFIMAKLKIFFSGRYLALRFVSSTFIASLVDSVIFTVIAFYGAMQNRELIELMLTMWLIKVAIEIVGLPISISLVKKLKQKEKLDIYDNNTNFNLFTLNTTYSEAANHFKKINF
jgi:uncharacterized integral membrane protein (TIGR00697 family)